jgi:hypothetical protein
MQHNCFLMHWKPLSKVGEITYMSQIMMIYSLYYYIPSYHTIPCTLTNILGIEVDTIWQN